MDKPKTNINSISDTVVKNLPGGFVQLETRLFPAIIAIAKVQILPISERNPPTKIFFIILTSTN